MSNETNLQQTIETSITPDQFIWGMKSERTCLMLMHNTVRRIQIEVRTIINEQMDQHYPDFSGCFRRILELEEYGFKAEALELLGEVGKTIQELQGHLIPYYVLQCKTLFPGYDYSSKVQVQKPSTLFKGDAIFIEVLEIKGGIATVNFCREKEKNSEDVMFYDAGIALEDLISFARNNDLDYAVSDSSDYAGEHVQTTTRIPEEVIIENCVQAVVKKYIKAGEPIVII